jgi:hypothetical protein
MTLRNALIATAVLFMVAPVVPALAHDDDDYSDHERMRKVFGVAVSTVPITVPLEICMKAIMATAMVINPTIMLGCGTTGATEGGSNPLHRASDCERAYSKKECINVAT